MVEKSVNYISKNRRNITFVLGIIILIVWFYLLPDRWKQPCYDNMETVSNIAKPYAIGIVDFTVLWIVCFLCKYTFSTKAFTWRSCVKQILGAFVLLMILLLGTTFFVNYTIVYQGSMPLVSFLFYQIVFVGFLEELLYRGILVHILRRYVVSTGILIFLCAVVFALAHVGSEVFSILQVTSAFGIGLIFTYLRINCPHFFTIYNLAIVHGILNVALLGFTTYMQHL